MDKTIGGLPDSGIGNHLAVVFQQVFFAMLPDIFPERPVACYPLHQSSALFTSQRLNRLGHCQVARNLRIDNILVALQVPAETPCGFPYGHHVPNSVAKGSKVCELPLYRAVIEDQLQLRPQPNPQSSLRPCQTDRRILQASRQCCPNHPTWDSELEKYRFQET